MIGRRRFLEALAALGVSHALPARATDRKVSFDSYPFTLGVASGYPSPSGVVLWTRLMGLDPLEIPVRWEVAADEAMRQVIFSGETTADPAWAHSARVEVQGLEPDRWYWYRFTAGDARSPIGRTRTAPAAAAPTQRLRFAFASCQQYEQGFLAPIATSLPTSRTWSRFLATTSTSRAGAATSSAAMTRPSLTRSRTIARATRSIAAIRTCTRPI